MHLGPWAAAAVLVVAAAFGAPAAAWDLAALQRSADRQGPRAQALLPPLAALLGELATVPDLQRLQRINDFFNRQVAFVDDLTSWGQADHWASPMETLGRGQGDCEDYSIAKYFSLIAAGVSRPSLRLVYVQARDDADGGRWVAHMVLAWYATPTADPMILDNLVPDVRPASARPDLRPVFSFNAEGLWQGVGAVSAGNPLARLSRWREVLAKARAEGFQ